MTVGEPPDYFEGSYCSGYRVKICAMGPNRRAQERARTAARAAAEAKRAEAERKAVADAQKVVAIWNARQAGGGALWFYPTIGAAIAAGVPWLSFSCPACGQFGSVELRTLDRHPGASIRRAKSRRHYVGASTTRITSSGGSLRAAIRARPGLCPQAPPASPLPRAYAPTR